MAQQDFPTLWRDYQGKRANAYANKTTLERRYAPILMAALQRWYDEHVEERSRPDNFTAAIERAAAGMKRCEAALMRQNMKYEFDQAFERYARTKRANKN